MGRDAGASPAPAIFLPQDTAERRFYIVMHHIATVLWAKDLSVEGMAALSAVLEWANGGGQVQEVTTLEAQMPVESPVQATETAGG